jgi:hypothetical protein
MAERSEFEGTESWEPARLLFQPFGAMRVGMHLPSQRGFIETAMGLGARGDAGIQGRACLRR